MAKVGRKTVMTPETIRKIEEVAALDGSVEEMAVYADIHPDTIYAHLKSNKEFSDRITALRNQPVLAARQTVIKKMNESYGNAIDYLSRKKKVEFSTRQELSTEIDLKISKLEEIQSATKGILK